MKKYGFYGGCFNPPTLAHIELAQNAIKKYKLDKLFIVPVGKHYKKENLLSSYEKINNYLYSNMSSSAIELELEKIAINNNFNIYKTSIIYD